MLDNRIPLPVPQKPQPPGAEPFPVGAQVYLAHCPEDAGTILGRTRGGKILVQWPT
jgi:hypothetical protein